MLTDEMLKEWRDSQTTQAVIEYLRSEALFRRRQILEGWWATQEASPAAVAHCKEALGICDDMMRVTAEEIEQAKKVMKDVQATEL